jgi:hypothetical protein
MEDTEIRVSDTGTATPGNKTQRTRYIYIQDTEDTEIRVSNTGTTTPMKQDTEARYIYISKFKL